MKKGVLKRLIDHQKCGFGYECDGETLANELEKLVSTPEELEGMKSKAGKVFSEMFDADKVYKAMVHHLEGVVENHSLEPLIDIGV